MNEFQLLHFSTMFLEIKLNPRKKIWRKEETGKWRVKKIKIMAAIIFEEKFHTQKDETPNTQWNIWVKYSFGSWGNVFWVLNLILKRIAENMKKLIEVWIKSIKFIHFSVGRRIILMSAIQENSVIQQYNTNFTARYNIGQLRNIRKESVQLPAVCRIRPCPRTSRCLNFKFRQSRGTPTSVSTKFLPFITSS